MGFSKLFRYFIPAGNEPSAVLSILANAAWLICSYLYMDKIRIKKLSGRESRFTEWIYEKQWKRDFLQWIWRNFGENIKWLKLHQNEQNRIRKPKAEGVCR